LTAQRSNLSDVLSLDIRIGDAGGYRLGHAVTRYDPKLWIGSGDGSAAYLPG